MAKVKKKSAMRPLQVFVEGYTLASGKKVGPTYRVLPEGRKPRKVVTRKMAARAKAAKRKRLGRLTSRNALP